MEIGGLILVFLVGVSASFIGAMVGSAGLINIPFLIFMGLPPHVAIATNKLGGVGLKLGAFTKYWKTNLIKWNYFVPLTILGILAALVGAQILLWIDKDLLSRIVVVLLLLVLPVIFLKKEIGLKQRITTPFQKKLGYIFYFFAQVFSAFFGGGAGTFVIYTLMYFFGLTIIEAGATAMLPSLVSNLMAVVIFAFSGIINYKFGIVLFLGTVTGGRLGAMFALKKGNGWVKIIFVIIVLVLVIKMILK